MRRDPQLRADTRGRDGGVREELAEGVAAMTNHDDVPTPLPALVCRLLQGEKPADLPVQQAVKLNSWSLSLLISC